MTSEGGKIGRIVSVSGSQVICLLEKTAEEPGVSTQVGPSLEVGAIVKIQATQSVLFGMVSSVNIPVPAADSAEDELRIAEIELLGEVVASESSSGFQRGVSFFPALGNDLYSATAEDLREIYACPGVSTACVGYLHQLETLPANVKTNDLLGKHFAVLGTTGSGKSCAVTVILKAILKENPQARILLLDPHDEYGQAFKDQAYLLDPAKNLDLPHWLFNFEELCEIVIDDDDLRSAQTALLGEAIIASKLKLMSSQDKYPITVDTPTPYWISDVLGHLQKAQGQLTRSEPTTAYQRLVNRLKALSNDSRFSFMFGRSSGGDNMKEILCQLFRIPVDGKPITITDLSGVPSEILNVVVSALCRLALDFAMWNEQKLPILIVCEEAHRYAPQAEGLGFEPTKRALSRIAKEGRKYGVSLCVVSQRPSDLATDLLSECNTIFALRMTNQSDQDFIRATMADSGLGLLEFLPSLRAREAIAIGEGVPVPQRLTFNVLPADELPRSKTASFSEAWANEVSNTDSVSAAIDRWRRRQKDGQIRRTA